VRAALSALDARITAYDHELEHLAHFNEAAERLMTINGVGPITALATVASVGASFRGNGALAARRAWVTSPSEGTLTCERC
jgi:transposase